MFASLLSHFSSCVCKKVSEPLAYRVLLQQVSWHSTDLHLWSLCFVKQKNRSQSLIFKTVFKHSGCYFGRSGHIERHCTSVNRSCYKMPKRSYSKKTTCKPDIIYIQIFHICCSAATHKADKMPVYGLQPSVLLGNGEKNSNKKLVITATKNSGDCGELGPDLLCFCYSNMNVTAGELVLEMHSHNWRSYRVAPDFCSVF